MVLTKEAMIEIIKTELTGGVVNLELTDSIISTNIDRALMISSDYWNYTDYKTIDITSTSTQGGYIPLSQIDPNGIPVIVAVYPTNSLLVTEAQLLGLGQFIISNPNEWTNRLNSYAQMIQKLSNLESILGRGAKVVGDKLYLDKFYTRVTVEYIPQVVEIENINEGSWLEWIIEYATALSKRQIGLARAKYVVSSNPATTNASELIEQANTTITNLEEQLKTRGSFYASR